MVDSKRPQRRRSWRGTLLRVCVVGFLGWYVWYSYFWRPWEDKLPVIKRPSHIAVVLMERSQAYLIDVDGRSVYTVPDLTCIPEPPWSGLAFRPADNSALESLGPGEPYTYTRVNLVTGHQTPIAAVSGNSSPVYLGIGGAAFAYIDLDGTAWVRYTSGRRMRIQDDVFALRPGPSGSVLLLNDKRELSVYTPRTFRFRRLFHFKDYQEDSYRFARVGAIVAVLEDGVLTLIDPGTGQRKPAPGKHLRDVHALFEISDNLVGLLAWYTINTTFICYDPISGASSKMFETISDLVSATAAQGLDLRQIETRLHRDRDYERFFAFY